MISKECLIFGMETIKLFYFKLLDIFYYESLCSLLVNVL